ALNNAAQDKPAREWNERGRHPGLAFPIADGTLKGYDKWECVRSISTFLD
ncbi:unnamed protein product, partial [marine sediment metagenome]